MSLTEIIRIVLDSHYSTIGGDNDVEKDNEVSLAFRVLTDSYRNLLHPGRKPVDYSNPATRFAYLYKYTVAHAEYFRQVLSLPEVGQCVREFETLKLASIGGGPGTEILGIFKYLSQAPGKLKKLSVQIYDMERGWSDNWSDVEEKCSLYVKYSSQFNQLDVTDETQWRAYNRLNERDLISFSFFLSELFAQKEQATPFFLHCLTSMKTEATVIYLDNFIWQVDEWFEEMCKQAGLEILVSVKDTILKYGRDEQVLDLGDYMERFSPVYPKIRGRVSYIVAQKPVQ